MGNRLFWGQKAGIGRFSMDKNKEAAYKENDGGESGSRLSSRQKVILDALLREYEVALMLDLSDDTPFSRYNEGIM